MRAGGPGWWSHHDYREEAATLSWSSLAEKGGGRGEGEGRVPARDLRAKRERAEQRLRGREGEREPVLLYLANSHRE